MLRALAWSMAAPQSLEVFAASLGCSALPSQFRILQMGKEAVLVIYNTKSSFKYPNHGHQGRENDVL